MRVPFLGLIATFACVAAFAGAGVAQAPAQHPPLAIRSLTGQDLFQFYCASCHGRDGKGRGPVAEALRTPPPDLTMMARESGGVFPGDRVEAYVRNTDGRSPAHGTSDMPVWGPIFSALDANDTIAELRIHNVVAHIATLQHP